MKKRSISEWASIAEIVGTMAVVISLVIVIVSIRQNTTVIRVTNETFQYDLMGRWLADMLHSPEIIDSWDRLLLGETLTKSERWQVIIMMQRSFNLWENAYANYKAGLLSEEQWSTLHESNLNWARRRVPESVWEELGGPGWQTDFRDLVSVIYQ